MRTIEGLTEYATSMLKPVALPLTHESFVESKDRFAVSFIYVGNDVTESMIESIKKANSDDNDNSDNSDTNDNNNDGDSSDSGGDNDVSIDFVDGSNVAIFYSSIQRYRPTIKFFVISRTKFDQLLSKNKQFQKEINLESIDSNIGESESLIIATTPSINAKIYSSNKLNQESVIEFVENNKFAPVIEMELREYKELFDSTQYFGVGFVNFENKDQEKENDEFVTKMENLMILKQNEWQKLPRENENKNENDKLEKEENKENDLDRKTTDERRKMMFAVANYSKYGEWATGMFGITEYSVPQSMFWQ